MSPFFKSGCCSLTSGDHSLDSEEFIEKSNNFLSWKMPTVPSSKLYRRKQFRLTSDRSIKTKEGKVSMGNGGGAIRLIHENPVMHTFTDKRFYATFNVGLIQIGVKTLTRKTPAKASIILIVRDTRREKIEDSLLGLVETKLSDGPFYFNVFPNITMSLFDSKMFDALTVEAMVEGFEHLPAGSKPISLTYRICYKLQSNCEPDALLESPDGKTVFFQTDVEGSNATVQKVCNWDEVISKLVFSVAEGKNQS